MRLLKQSFATFSSSRDIRGGILKILLIVGMVANVSTRLVSTQLCAQEDSSPSAATGNLMTTLFSPVIAAEPKAMAVLQRTSLLNEVAKTKSLQIALVVDGTESMSAELESIRKHLSGMVKDLSEVLGDRLSIQIVVYRDVGADRVVEYPLLIPGNAFTDNIETIEEGLKLLTPQSGAPYFLEPVDIGLNAAMTQLAWSNDPSVARWILLIGDAPPFEMGFKDEHGAERKFSEEQLLFIAKDKGIIIHTLLCPTRPEDKESYDKVLPEAKSFFGSMAVNTGGVCFDLSDRNFRNAISDAAKRAAVEYIKIREISQDEIDRVATSVVKAPEAKTNRTAKFVVLPFMPKQSNENRNYFDKGRESVKFAEEIARQIDLIGGKKASFKDIKTETVKKLDKGLRGDALVKSVGDSLECDYVLCVSKEVEPNKKARFEYTVMESSSGKYVVPLESRSGDTPKDSDAGEALLKVIALRAKTLPTPSDLKSFMAKVTPVPPKIRTVSFANSTEVEELIASARTALDGIVEVELLSENDDNSQDIEKAISASEKLIDDATKIEKNNAAICAISANIRMAKIILHPHAPEFASWRNEAIEFLREGKEIAVGDAKIEFEADLSMMKGDLPLAARKYAEVVKAVDSPSAKLRARWMLMGIHSGDWSTKDYAKELVDAELARKYAIEILALHSESRHAKRLRGILQIDASSATSASPALPVHSNPGLVGTPSK